MFLGEEPRPADHCLGVLGLANALIGAIVMLVLLVIDGLVVPELSDVWVAHGAHSEDAVLSGTILSYTIFNLLLGTGLVLWRRATASSAGGDRAGEVPVPVGSRSLDVEGALV